MKVWLVGSAGYDFHSIEYVCLSYESALKRWSEVRNELISRAKEMIEYDYKEGLDWNVPSWEREIKLLQNLKPGESCQCDFPIIEEMVAEL